MLAITTTEALSVLDQATLKKTPSSIPSCLPLTSPPIATSWALDNRFLFIASERTIHRYDPESNLLVDLFSSPENLSSLVVKDRASAIFSANNKVHILEYGETSKISQTFTTHKATVNSLAISSDLTLLASTSADTVYIHNLTLASHTALRGLPISDQQSIRTCSFHPHSRTRLLLGIGRQLVIYDTSRPSGPTKIISLQEASSGSIDAISCSPFSKTLVAVTTTGGTLGLVDLDKEKGLFRTINMKMPIASLSFSQEGATIYIGTENGKLLILDLRALDKPPKAMVISDTGARLQTMSVQTKTKSVSEALPKSTGIAKGSELAPRKPSATIASVNRPSPSQRVVSASLKGKTVRTALSRDKDPIVKKAFSPLRNPPGVNDKKTTSDDEFSLQIDNLSGLRGPPKKDPKSPPVKDTRTRLHLSSISKSNSTSRTRDEVNAPAVSSRLRPPPSQPSPLSASSRSKPSSKKGDIIAPRRNRTVSSASSTAIVPSPLSASASKQLDEDSSAVVGRMRTLSSSVQTTKATRKSSSDSAVSSELLTDRTGTDQSAPAKDLKKTSSHLLSSTPSSGSKGLPSDAAPRRRNISLNSRRCSKMSTKTTTTFSSANRSGRMSSSDLSDSEAPVSLRPDPETPLPSGGRRKLSVGLALGNADDDDQADVDDLAIQKNKVESRIGKEKARVLFQEDQEEAFFDDEESEEDESDSGKENQQPQEREESLSMQISPRRPGQSASASASGISWANHKSPIRHSHSHSHLYAQYTNIPGSPGTSPQDLLRNIVRDVMYDFHQESRSEMMGLHLDLVSMGRGWKRELRELMGEYGGELKELREENRKLREENERLRRGY